VVLFGKGTLNKIRENRFVAFSALLFVANLPVYWMASLKNPALPVFLFAIVVLLFFSICGISLSVVGENQELKCCLELP
jgi:hypothetical protein